jgi:chromosome segregation and condensation protein ScpB
MQLVVDTRTTRGATIERLQNYMSGCTLEDISEFFQAQMREITLDDLSDSSLETLAGELSDRMSERQVYEAEAAA